MGKWISFRVFVGLFCQYLAWGSGQWCRKFLVAACFAAQCADTFTVCSAVSSAFSSAVNPLDEEQIFTSYKVCVVVMTILRKKIK